MKLKTGRKFGLFLFAFLLSIVFLVAGIFTADQFIKYTMYLFGFFCAGNVGEHGADALKKKYTP